MERKLQVPPRLPLKETSGNIPLPVLKKAKLNSKSHSGTTSTTTATTSTNTAAGTQPCYGTVIPTIAPETTASTVTSAAVAAKHRQSPSKSNRLINVAKNTPMNNAVTTVDVNTTSASTTTTTTTTVVKASTLVGEELLQWQQEWRRIMKISIVYFDTQGCDQSSVPQQNEQKRAARSLRSVGCRIARFFDREVTIIVSRRSYDSLKRYQHNDIFHDVPIQKIKVWNYDKVFRFLKNIGFNEQSFQQNPTGELCTLLREEKIFGTNDRDPNARRDDLHYLGQNYLYVYDPAQELRPIAVREWAENSIPNLHLTLDGKCPFMGDGTNEVNLERRKLRRQQKFEAGKLYRDSLKQATTIIMHSYKANFKERKFEDTLLDDVKIDLEEVQELKQQDEDTINDNEIQENEEEEDEEEEEEEEEDDFEEELELLELESSDLDRTVENDSKDDSSSTDDCTEVGTAFVPPPPVLARQSSVMQPEVSKYYDFAASGFNGASNAQMCSMDSSLNSAATGNGLGPTVSQVPSKNINNLKRRIFMKKQQQQKQQGHLNAKLYNEKEKESRPGYCENCRVKYDNFNDHIASNRHRNFACDDSNFRDIDELIGTLEHSKWPVSDL